jgi:hypothetical protein
MPEQPPRAQPAGPGRSDHEAEAAEDLRGATEGEDAYERAQPDSQPKTSSEPEPGGEPADAG